MIKKKLAPFYNTLCLGFKYKNLSFIERIKIMVDYYNLYRKKGLTTSEYYDFEFERQPDDFRNTFLGLNEQRFYLDYLNPIKYYSFARNKYLSHILLENTGVRKSELYCYYQPEGLVYESNQVANNLKSVSKILRDKAVVSCVVKTTESSHGDNVWVIKHIEFQEDDVLMTRFDGNKLFLSEILSTEPLIFESLIHQTEQFALLNESSVNTVRFMTCLYPDGHAEIIAAFIKIGRAGKCVDNAGDGGNVDVCVDVATGEIKYPVEFNGWRQVSNIENHPDSGNPLNGVFINNWSNIKNEVVKFQQAFPYCKAAGWDIAITDEGPLVIEVNDFWDRTGQYFIRKGWRNEIRNCYFAWKKTSKEYNMYRLSNALSVKALEKIVKKN